MFYLVLILSVVYLPTNFAICRQSYATFCDSFDDLTNYQNKEEITELVIGSAVSSNKMMPVHLMSRLILSLYNNLHTLTVLYSINTLQSTYASQCDYHGKNLQLVQFYGNEFTEIKQYLFPLFSARIFSLRNNQIEVIKTNAFFAHKVEAFDASNNRLEVIEANSLPQTDATTAISLQNNKISHIEPNSLGTTLKSLKLGQNKLRHILPEVLAGLSNLEELNLSYNQFIQIPEISNMAKLIVFDISYNKISTVFGKMFESMKNLQLLDLSGNKIQYTVMLTEMIPSGVQSSLTLSLAFNSILFINTTGFNLMDMNFILHGNPLDCDKWDGLKKKLEGHTSRCEEELWSSGKVPFCFKFLATDYFLNANFKKDVKNFHNVVREQVEISTCKLTPRRYKLLKPVIGGCVA